MFKVGDIVVGIKGESKGLVGRVCCINNKVEDVQYDVHIDTYPKSLGYWFHEDELRQATEAETLQYEVTPRKWVQL